MSADLAEDEHPRPLLEAWAGVLDRLEQDVSLAEKLLTHSHADLEAALERGPGSWQPPELHHPLPASLLPRARDLARRQVVVRDGLERAVAGTRAGIERARRTSYAEIPAAPAYVDVSA